MSASFPRPCLLLPLALASLLLGLGWWLATGDDGRASTARHPAPATVAPPRLQVPGSLNDQTAPARSPATGEASNEPLSPPPAAGPPPAVAEAAPATPPARGEPVKETGPGERFMQIYNGQSGRLTNGDSFEARHGIRRYSVGTVPLEVWTSKSRLEPGEKAEVFISGTEPEVQIESAVAHFSGGGAEKQVAMSAQGADFKADFLAEPAFYGPGGSAAAQPGLEGLVDVVILVRFRHQGKTSEHQASTMLFVQDSGARLLPQTAEVTLTAEGNAQLTVEIETRKDDFYYLYAELWSPSRNASIAFGRKSLDKLPPGRHRVSVIFGGQVILASGIDGPYAIRNVELSRVSPTPPQLSPPVAELLTTPAWKASEFR